MITVNPEKAKEIHNAKQRQARAQAFSREHDPLVGMAMRQEIDQAELIAKAAEIRARFPYQD
jgi:hypothetical protein